MKRSISVSLGCAALLLISSGVVRAQSAPSDKMTINVNVGYQAQSQDVTTNGTFSLYGEDGTYTGAQTVGTGVLFDIGAQYGLTKSLGVGVSWSYFTNTSSVAVQAQVPHPLFANQFRAVSGSAGNADHTESVFNIDLVYRWPFSNKIDLVFYGGPTVAMIKHDVVTGLTVNPETFPFNNPTISGFALTSHSKTGFGGNVGADAQYMFTPRFGAGAGLRYVYATASVPGATDNVKAGGLQVLGGLRVRF